MKQNEIAKLLPEVFQRTLLSGSPLTALLDVMEDLHGPSEEVLLQIEAYFAPYRAPDRFVPYLAQWVDLGPLLEEVGDTLGQSTISFATGLGRLRDLIATAAFLSQWRGTTRGLLAYLEIALGVRGYRIDESVRDAEGKEIPFHLRIQAPIKAEPYRPLMERIIEIEKPAHVTYELVFDDPAPAPDVEPA